MASCSVTAAGDLLLVCTSQRRGQLAQEARRARRPELHRAGQEHGQAGLGRRLAGREHPRTANGRRRPMPCWAACRRRSSPAATAGSTASLAKADARPASPSCSGSSTAIPRTAVWKDSGHGDRNQIIATPVIDDGRVYIATGQDPEYGEGAGRLWCIDPTKRGDVSPEMVVDKDGKPLDDKTLREPAPHPGPSTPRPARRSSPIRIRPPSGTTPGVDANGDGKFDFEETMHRALGMRGGQRRPAGDRRLRRAGPLPGREDRQAALDARHARRRLGLAPDRRRQDLHRRRGRRRGRLRALGQEEPPGRKPAWAARSTARPWPSATRSTSPPARIWWRSRSGEFRLPSPACDDLPLFCCRTRERGWG